MDPKHLAGQDRKLLSPEQYAILLTALNTTVTIAHTCHDHELYTVAIEQLSRFASELHSNGYQETWRIDTQSYTVAKKG
jgi:hypothetical protein